MDLPDLLPRAKQPGAGNPWHQEFLALPIESVDLDGHETGMLACAESLDEKAAWAQHVCGVELVTLGVKHPDPSGACQGELGVRSDLIAKGGCPIGQADALSPARRLQ
jgi:hypothetical protein